MAVIEEIEEALVEEAPPEDRDPSVAALEWVNETRARLGLEPLGELLRGKRNNGRFCPIALSICWGARDLQVKVTCTDITLSNLSGLASNCQTPPCIYSFISRFDHGELPEYELPLYSEILWR